MPHREQVVAVIKHQRTAPAGFFVEAPGPGGERHLEIIDGIAGVDVHAHPAHLTDLTGFDHLFGLNCRGVIHKGLINPQHHAGLVGGRDHLVRLGS